MDDLKIVLQLLKQFGGYGALLIAIVLLIHDPTRAEKLKLAFLTPFFRFWKWGARQYLATKVGLSVSEFFRHQVTGLLSSASKLKFKIRWVRTASDPVLKKNGTLILRLEETNDQTRNILSATKVALAKTICPTLRSQMRPHMQNAIDLALLRKLSEGLGRHAHQVFSKYFLEPQTKDDNECAELLTELVEIDRAGLFVAIFLEELALLGDFTFSSNDREDKTEAIKKFLVFLLGLARREEFAEIELDHVSDDIQVGIILLARTQLAAAQGVTPYVKRINRTIRSGCDTIYIVAFKPAVAFQKNLVRAIAEDVRISVAKTSRIAVQPSKGRRSDSISLVQLRISRFADTGFDARLRECPLSEGDMITGKVLDVAEQVALVTVDGLTGSIGRKHCSWSTVMHCSDVLSEGDELRFQIKKIDKDRGMLVLTRRFEDEDPFKCCVLPVEGDTVEVLIHGSDTDGFIATRDDGLEIRIPFLEVSWMEDAPKNHSEFLGRKLPVHVYEVDELQHVIRGSLRRLDTDPWPSFHKRFPTGTRARGKVVEVDRLLHFVRVEIADGVIGIIPAESMIAAGYEYRDFENTVTVGQVFDVVVTKVFLNKRKIRLDLQRNQQDAPTPKKDAGRWRRRRR